MASDNFYRISKGLSLRPQPGTPSNGANGDIYYDSVANKFYGYQNGSWTILISGAGSDPTTTKGDIAVNNGSALARLPVGTNGQILTADSTQTLGVKWATSSGGSSTAAPRFTLSGAASEYFTCIDGCYRSKATNTLASVDISMLDSGSSGSTIVTLNQYRSGSLQASATATFTSSSGNPKAANVALSGSLSLLADDLVTIDLTTYANGTPSELSVELILT